MKLSRYVIQYRDPDPGAPVFTWECRAYSHEDAKEQFRYDCTLDNWDDAIIVSCRSWSQWERYRRTR